MLPLSSSASLTPDHARAGKARSAFYPAMAAVSAAIALLGFSRRYFFKMAAGNFEAPPIVHVHGFITFVWVALVVAQTALVAKGRTAAHRSLGLLGISVGTLLVWTATQVTILLLARELREGGPSPREFSATMLGIALMIAALFAGAVAYVNRPQIHKRLMLLATFVILTPALARIIQMLAPSLTRLLRNDLAGAASDALIAVALVHDLRTRGKPHPAYVIGAAGVVAVQLLVLLVRATPAWYAATNWIAKLAAT
jgi:hypothetical protein